MCASKTENEIIYNRELIIGSGSFGIVYKGTYMGHTVAAKVIPFILSTKANIFSELKALLTLSEIPHDNVLQCYKMQEETHGMVMALELCDTTLKDLVSTKGTCILPATISQLEIIQQMTAGIKYMHTRNIVHLDLKPDNILLKTSSTKAVVRISDFGLSKLIPPEKSNVTGSGAGTPGWAASEVMQEEQVKDGDVRPTRGKLKLVNFILATVNPIVCITLVTV